MIEFIAGIISGTISALGMGGGSVLILILSIFLNVEQHVAQASNIIFFIAASSIAITMNIKNKMIDWKISKAIVIYGIIGAIIGAQISLRLDTATLKKAFGVFLGVIAIYEIYRLVRMYKTNKKSHTSNIK